MTISKTEGGIRMDELPIAARLIEVNDGPSYGLKVKAVPRVGELIELYSYLEAQAKQPTFKYYEVVAVVHKIHEVSERVPVSEPGAHEVRIYVKESHSSNLRSFPRSQTAVLHDRINVGGIDKLKDELIETRER